MPKSLELTNKRFGRLIAIEVVFQDGVRCWRCICDCGKETITTAKQLNNGHKNSCGCLKQEMYDNFSLLGKQFGMLTVIEFAGYGLRTKPQWKCKCECGGEIVTYSRYLTRGSTTHCGCMRIENLSKPMRKGYGESTKNSIISMYKSNALHKELDFDLTNERMEELFKGNCYYCGCEPNNLVDKPTHYGTYTYNGIDRLDPKLGYVEGNVVSCCRQCNYLKGTYTDKDFLDIIRKISSYKKLA